MRHSLYWDDFERRITETVSCVRQGQSPPVRRVSVFVTDRCNFRCAYCNGQHSSPDMPQATFEQIVTRYGNDAIIHITGGEPSVVPWLYPYLREHGHRYRFHLNTNAYIEPPASAVKRLKVSLDSCDGRQWDSLVGTRAFDRVVANIKASIPHTVVSVTCTLTHENLRDAPRFIEFCNQEFPSVYAVFFSTYKGTNPRFVFTDSDADEFFSDILPQMKPRLSEESLNLLGETLDEKRRLIAGERFPENRSGTCYLSLSERVFDNRGNLCYCSHLYRDGIVQQESSKHQKCLYGCNRRLVAFNEAVEQQIAGQ